MTCHAIFTRFEFTWALEKEKNMVDYWGEIVMQQIEASFPFKELQKADLKNYRFIF